MRFIFSFLLLVALLEASGFEWSAYKDTLFVGEPIILMPKFRNTGDEPVNIPEFHAGYPYNNFDLIFRDDTFKYFPGYDVLPYRYTPDSILVLPRDSVYSYTLLFWKDFLGKEKGNPTFSKDGDRCKIWINKTDTVSLFFITPPKEETEVFEAMKNYHEAMQIKDKTKYRSKLLKNFLKKPSHLSPYLYLIQYIWNDLPTQIKTVKVMTNRFPRHILTEWAEILLMQMLYRDNGPKSKEMAKEMLIELARKYPSNIIVRKVLKESAGTLRSKSILKRKTLIERFRWELKKKFRQLKYIFRRLVLQAEIKIARFFKWLKSKRSTTKKESVTLRFSGLYNLADCALINKPLKE